MVQLLLQSALQNTMHALIRYICISGPELGKLIHAPNTLYNTELRKFDRMQCLDLNMHVQFMLKLIY